MSAYAAVISLKNTIQGILEPSRILLDPPSSEIIQLLYKKLTPLQEILQSLDHTRKNKSRKNINALDGRIKDAVWRFEDLLEDHITDHILLQFENHQDQRRKISARSRRMVEEELHSQNRSFEGEGDVVLFSIDLQGLQHEVSSFIRRVENMEEEYIYELENLPDEEPEEEEERIGFGGKKSKMVGSYHQLELVRNGLMEKYFANTAYVILGMGGIGKTTLAEEIFEDPLIRSHYDHRVWVRVGRKSRAREYYAHAVVAQLDPNYEKRDEKEIGEYLKERLEGKKCLIVFDDVWEKEVLYLVMSSLPTSESGTTRILVTSRDGHVGDGMHIYVREFLRVPFLNDEDSKDLLCKKVFGEETTLPFKFEKAAEKIATKCEGLPLLIVAVADRLSKGDMTEEYWNEVAQERNSVFMDAYNDLSKVLFPSYEYLPQYLKMLFLYLGVFPPDCDTTPSKLINMLNGEGWFLDLKKDDYLSKCLEELYGRRSLVRYKKRSIQWYPRSGNQKAKTCRLHSSFRHLCKTEARKNKFYHVLNRCVDCVEEVIKGQRCLCLHNNILFGIKQVFDAVQCYCASSMRSLLCFGPYQQYPVPIDVGFKLLREFDALKLRFYTFPTEILKLVRLRYLTLTCNGDLPPTISKLFDLRVLIVHPHMSIRSGGAPSCIPVEIWDMQELEHLEILGRILPSPHHVASLEKLSTLVGVNASICTTLELLKKCPNVRKLGVQIEMTPVDEGNNILNCFHHISMLEELETLKCSVVNLEMNRGLVGPPSPSLLRFPLGLRKLHLSGMGFPWEYMDAIGSLSYLQVLKLRCYAFRGPKWDVKGRSFSSLLFLLIEDTDLVQWSSGPGSFPRLSHLSMKHCYELEELHWPPNPGFKYRYRKIELVDCNPLAVTYAEDMVFAEDQVTATFSF